MTNNTSYVCLSLIEGIMSTRCSKTISSGYSLLHAWLKSRIHEALYIAVDTIQSYRSLWRFGGNDILQTRNSRRQLLCRLIITIELHLENTLQTVTHLPASYQTYPVFDLINFYQYAIGEARVVVSGNSVFTKYHSCRIMMEIDSFQRCLLLCGTLRVFGFSVRHWVANGC